MLVYKNTSNSVKTFYGVQFKPGETHEVPGYINNPRFVRVESKPKEPPKVNTNKSPVKPDDSSNKQKAKSAELKHKDETNKTENMKEEENPNGTDNN